MCIFVLPFTFSFLICTIDAGLWRYRRIKCIGLEWCSTRQVQSFCQFLTPNANAFNFHPNILQIPIFDPWMWIVETLRLVGIRWECAPGGSTRKAPSSLSALANLMIRSGMVSSGWKPFFWCTSKFINCSGLSFSPGLRTRAGQPAEENTNLKLPKIWI